MTPDAPTLEQYHLYRDACDLMAVSPDPALRGDLTAWRSEMTRLVTREHSILVEDFLMENPKLERPMNHGKYWTPEGHQLRGMTFAGVVALLPRAYDYFQARGYENLPELPGHAPDVAAWNLGGAADLSPPSPW